MFRRKDEGGPESGSDMTDNQKTANTSSADNYLVDPNRSSTSPTAAATAGAAAATPYQAPDRSRPEPSKLAPGAGYRPTVTPPSGAPRPGMDSRPSGGMQMDKTRPTRSVLTVGHGIELKGEIATCDRLVIEGQVDATLNNVHTMEIAEGGSFKGAAKIEEAEISGLFDGDLEVRGRLIIYSTGKVRGKISYGEIEIERGGELTGEIKINGTGAKSEKKTSNAA